VLLSIAVYGSTTVYGPYGLRSTVYGSTVYGSTVYGLRSTVYSLRSTVYGLTGYWLLGYLATWLLGYWLLLGSSAAGLLHQAGLRFVKLDFQSNRIDVGIKKALHPGVKATQLCLDKAAALRD
jgi:hypothetical protein